MTDHPILFSGPMVRAIMAGRKTQTRRAVNGQDDLLRDGLYQGSRCPYGQPGDRLWVRETHCLLDIPHSPWPDLPHRCGGDGLTCHYRVGFDRTEPHWRPSIHMPRWASRLTLEVLDVRVERLQDISYIDIRAEGVDCPEHDGPGFFCCSECLSLRAAFQRLWDSINGKRPGCSWIDNPWVWRVEFRVTG